VTERRAVTGQTTTRMKERIYLGSFEVYREYESDGDTVLLEHEILHIMDDRQRVALIETRTLGNEPEVPRQLVRYQLGNHLGSAILELDDEASIISYEEYYPYGSTSYQAVRSATERSKRHRYTGLERDEETGLNYHGERYYAPWLGRWGSADPRGLVDGPNLYQYSLGNPIVRFDATGTDSERTYQLGLGFDETGLRWDPRANPEINTNLTELILGGLAQSVKGYSWYWQVPILIPQFYATVSFHEGGHYQEALRQKANPDLILTLGFIPTEVRASGLTNRPLFFAAGVNQNTLNARQIWRNLKLSGGDRSVGEGLGYWANQSYLFQYTLRAIADIGKSNDIKNYVSATNAGLKEVFATALATTALNINSEIFAKKIEKVFGNKIVSPRFQTLLTSSGDLLLGVQTIARLGGRFHALEVNLDATPNFSAFSLGLKAHDIFPDKPSLSLSPSISLSNLGVSFGAELTYDLNSWLGLRVSFEHRSGSNPLNEVEGRVSGPYGTTAATVRF
jgi:RHS repeat-associated protein